jgi:hypothetical protein
MKLEDLKMFKLGQIFITQGIKEIIKEEPILEVTLEVLLESYQRGDWGIICDEDKRANNKALIGDSRILAAYMLGNKKIWVITEWDRSLTTILLPEEY